MFIALEKAWKYGLHTGTLRQLLLWWTGPMEVGLERGHVTPYLAVGRSARALNIKHTIAVRIK